MENQRNDEKVPIQQTNQTELPFDLITQNILTRLPIKSLVRFKSVSKLWLSTLSSSRFALDHFKSSQLLPTQSLLIRSGNKFQMMSCQNGEIDLVNLNVDFGSSNEDLINFGVDFDVGDEELALVGSCNGLVCLGSTSGALFILWNPVTREFRKYLDLEISKYLKTCFQGFMVSWGFGYVSSMDDYKVVRICKKRFTTSFRIHLYSIRQDKWEMIGNETQYISDDFSNHFSALHIPVCLCRSGVTVNETLYWMSDNPSRSQGRLPRAILSVDLASVMFDTFPHVEESTPYPSSYVKRVNKYFDELLCDVKDSSSSKHGQMIICGQGSITMSKIIGGTELLAFSKDWAISMHGESLIGLTGSDKILTQCSGSHHAPHLGILVINPMILEHQELMTYERWSNRDIVSYCPSLISQSHVMKTLEDEDEDSNIVKMRSEIHLRSVKPMKPCYMAW